MSDPTERSEQDEVSELSLIRWMLGLCWKYRKLFLLAVVMQAALSVFAVLGLNLLGLGIDYLANASGFRNETVEWPFGYEPPSDWEPLAIVYAIGAAALASAVLHGVLFYGSATAVAKLVHGKIAPELQRRVFLKLQKGCLRFYSKQPSGAMINWATGDIQAVRSFVDLALMEAITVLIAVSIYSVYMLQIHAGLAFACLVFVPLMAWRSFRFSRVTRPLFLAYRKSFDNMILYLSESIRGASVIRGFSLEERSIERMRKMNSEIWDCQSRIFSKISLFAPSINMLSHTSLLVLLVYGGYLVMENELALGAGFVVFAGLLQQFSNKISNIAQIANATQESLTGARRLFGILNTESEVQQSARAIVPDNPRAEVRFDAVTVSYNAKGTALHDISFEVPEGEVVAVIGETGSGKSSLLSLIPRLYDPSEGSVSISGIDVRELDLDWLRKYVGVVFQDAFIFSQTVAENIRFGNSEATQEEVENAAKLACADEFIRDLENGYGTVIGEMGVDLSGGQRQRLSLARALASNPEILLLDDPTSAIDPSTERRILDGLKLERSRCTTFIVAHRIATLSRADRIMVLKKGRVAQFGTHDELRYQDGIYARIIEDQSGHDLEQELKV